MPRSMDETFDLLAAINARMDSMEAGGGSKDPLKADAVEVKDKIIADEGEEVEREAEEKEADKKAPEVAADRRKDAGEERGAAPFAKGPPAKKADAEEGEDEKADAEEGEDEKADRADAATVRRLEKTVAEQSRLISRMASFIKPRGDDEHAQFADAQARADAVYQGFGKTAPRPLEGEGLLNYRKRLSTGLKSYSAAWKSVKMSELPAPAFDIAEQQIYADSTEAARNPTDLGDGELRAVTRTDSSTGLRTTSFYGKHSFVRDMGRPARRVQHIRTFGSL